MGMLQMQLLAMFVLAAVFDGFDLQSIGFLAPLIAKSLNFGVSSFGAIFSAGLIGLGIGSIALSHVADALGRRRALIGALVFVGVLSALTALAATRGELLALRFLTSLGLGGALPVIAALTVEYTPSRLHKIALCLIYAALPAGGFVAGIVAALILPIWGWKSVFIVGGLLPLALAGLLAVALPESVSAGHAAQSIAAWASRLWPGKAEAGDILATAQPAPAPVLHAPLRALFDRSVWMVTLPLWLAFFASLLLLYSFINWVPVLLASSGFPPAIGVRAISTFSLGGIIGTLLQGPLMTRFGLAGPILAEYAGLGVLIVLFSLWPLTNTSITVLTFAIGWMLQGAQSGINAFAVTFYPASIRTRALGWALACGRLGSIAGALLGGWALGVHLSPRTILIAASVPAAVCVAAFAVSARSARRF
jgi:AAHS family 4-hydroxybenzoate transporter-like MFS transporter